NNHYLEGHITKLVLPTWLYVIAVERRQRLYSSGGTGLNIRARIWIYRNESGESVPGLVAGAPGVLGPVGPEKWRRTPPMFVYGYVGQDAKKGTAGPPLVVPADNPPAINDRGVGIMEDGTVVPAMTPGVREVKSA